MAKRSILIIGNSITKDEQLEIARLLIKAGYEVSVIKGKTVNGKSRIFINYEALSDGLKEEEDG